MFEAEQKLFADKIDAAKFFRFATNKTQIYGCVQISVLFSDAREHSILAVIGMKFKISNGRNIICSIQISIVHRILISNSGNLFQVILIWTVTQKSVTSDKPYDKLPITMNVIEFLDFREFE